MFLRNGYQSCKITVGEVNKAYSSNSERTAIMTVISLVCSPKQFKILWESFQYYPKKSIMTLSLCELHIYFWFSFIILILDIYLINGTKYYMAYF